MRGRDTTVYTRFVTALSRCRRRRQRQEAWSEFCYHYLVSQNLDRVTVVRGRDGGVALLPMGRAAVPVVTRFVRRPLRASTVRSDTSGFVARSVVYMTNRTWIHGGALPKRPFIVFVGTEDFCHSDPRIVARVTSFPVVASPQEDDDLTC